MKKILGLVLCLFLSGGSQAAMVVGGAGGDQPVATGVSGTFPQTKASGAVFTADRHARYMNTVLGGNTYIAAMRGSLAGSVGIATGVGMTATPVLSLCNPIGSGKLGVLMEIGIDVTASPAAAAGFELGVSSTTLQTYPTGLTSAYVYNANTASSSLPVLQAYTVSTWAYIPTAMRFLGGTTGAAAIGGVYLTDSTDGKVIVGPGTCVGLFATSAATILADFEWEEISMY